MMSHKKSHDMIKNEHILIIENVIKNYGAVQALRGVTMKIRRGSIHGLLGENGAGKSTLVSIISGQITPTSGKIFMDEYLFEHVDVKIMEEAGVFLVTQESMIINNMSAAENLMLGIWPQKKGFVCWKKLQSEACRILKHSDIKYNMPASYLDAVARRKLNILRAMFSGGKLIILDEPTAALTIVERQQLFDFMRRLKLEGVTFIFISHYNDEILEICDSVTVLRDGSLAGEAENVDILTSEQITELVTGRGVELFQRKRRNHDSKTSVISLRSVHGKNLLLSNFDIAAGEIVGFTGLPGAGAKEAARAIFGLHSASGTIIINGRTIDYLPKRPDMAFDLGIAYLSDDRRRDGAVSHMSISENIALSSLHARSKFGFIDFKAEESIVMHYFNAIDIKALNPNYAVDTLSGGNQQKVCLGRVLATKPRLLIVDEPTRGIDIVVKQQVLRIIDELSDSGVAVIIVSTDTEELVRAVDRVCIFKHGNIKEVLIGNDINVERLRASYEAVVNHDNNQTGEFKMCNTTTGNKKISKNQHADCNVKTILSWILKNIVWIWLIALVIIFGGFNEFFLTVANLQNIMVQATVLGMLGLAIALPLLVAEIDLSVPANAGFSAAAGVLVYSTMELPWSLSVIVGLLTGTLVGFFNGFCITRMKMVSLIETLAMMIILQGSLLALTKGKTLTNLDNGYIWIGQATVAGWPVMPVVFILALVAIHIILKRTVLGRSIYATGGNPVASSSAGIRVHRIKIITYTISGFLAALAGFLLASWQMAITSNQGSSYLLYAIAAPIIGGVSVFGGRGNVKGILGGVLLLTVIQVGLAIVNVPSFYVGMIGGVMIFVAVAIDAFRVRYFG